MVTEAPTTPLDGETEVIVGAPRRTVNASLLVPVEAKLFTAIEPVVAEAGTVVVIWVSEFTVKLAEAPLNLTEVAPVKPLPVSTTEVPLAPLVGVKEASVMIGRFRSTKLWA